MILAAMRRDQHHLPVSEKAVPIRPNLAVALALAGPEEGIDDGIPGNTNLPFGNPLVQQIVFSSLRRSGVQRGDDARDPPVEFFRPRLLKVARAEAGFNVDKR